MKEWGFCIGDREPFNSTRYTAVLRTSDGPTLFYDVMNIEGQPLMVVTMHENASEEAARRIIRKQVEERHRGQS